MVILFRIPNWVLFLSRGQKILGSLPYKIHEWGKRQSILPLPPTKVDRKVTKQNIGFVYFKQQFRSRNYRGRVGSLVPFRSSGLHLSSASVSMDNSEGWWNLRSRMSGGLQFAATGIQNPLGRAHVCNVTPWNLHLWSFRANRRQQLSWWQKPSTKWKALKLFQPMWMSSFTNCWIIRLFQKRLFASHPSFSLAFLTIPRGSLCTWRLGLQF